jgi:hypothetical protein
MLAQQASGYDVGGCNFHVQEKLMHKKFSFSHAGADQLAKLTAPVGSTDSLSAEAQSAQLTSLVGHADSSKSVKPTAPVGLADSPMANPANLSEKLSKRPNITSSNVGADLYD